MLTQNRCHQEGYTRIHGSSFPSVDYILTSCSFTTLGITSLLKDRKYPCKVIKPIGKDVQADVLYQITPDSRVVVFLPDEPESMLATLQVLSLLCRRFTSPLSVLIFSALQPEWLYRTLLALSGREHLLRAVRIVSPKSTLSQLTNILGRWELAPLLAEQSPSRSRRGGITTRELGAVLSLLRNEPVAARTQRLGLSRTTQYSQRASGLQKLSALFPFLNYLLPRSLRTVENCPSPGNAPSLRSPDECVFKRALQQGQVFPVFQPITDRHFAVKGFEILVRWRRDGKVLKPEDFLPKIRTPDTWILLTAFVIREAVHQVNRTGGAFYFTINIPACVVESCSLIRMMATARLQLNDTGMADRLVLEISETTDVSLLQVRENIRLLQGAGHRVLLDDCFADDCTIVPVCGVKFNGYKLDMSIVNTFMNNHRDASLIRSLVVDYCNNGVECIAEGIDSNEKFIAMCRAGVTGFQGYYLSRPVGRESLDETIRQLQIRHNKQNPDGWQIHKNN